MKNPFELTDGCFSTNGRKNREVYFAADSYTLVRVQADGVISIDPDMRPEFLRCLEIKDLPASELYSVMRALLLASEFARDNGVGKLEADFVHFN